MMIEKVVKLVLAWSVLSSDEIVTDWISCTGFLILLVLSALLAYDGLSLGAASDCAAWLARRCWD